MRPGANGMDETQNLDIDMDVDVHQTRNNIAFRQDNKQCGNAKDQ
jgi:hypothetical protein